jgi:hypothetical protein
MIGKQRGEAKGSSRCGGVVAIKAKAPFYRPGRQGGEGFGCGGRWRNFKLPVSTCERNGEWVIYDDGYRRRRGDGATCFVFLREGERWSAPVWTSGGGLAFGQMKEKSERA